MNCRKSDDKLNVGETKIPRLTTMCHWIIDRGFCFGALLVFGVFAYIFIVWD